MKEGDTPSHLQFSEERKNEKEQFATIRFHGNLGKLENGKRLEEKKVAVPIKIGQILVELQSDIGIELRRDSTLILVNGVEANALEDLETVIVQGDEVALVPMFHGGES